MCICSCKDTQEKIPARDNNKFVLISFEDHLIKGADVQVTGNFGPCPHEIFSRGCYMLKVGITNALNGKTFGKCSNRNNPGQIFYLF